MSDKFKICVILIFAWMGIFLSSELARQRSNVFFCITVNTIIASCIVAVHNVYFIQALPFLGFAIILSIVVAGLSNFFPFASYLQYSVAPVCYLSYIVRVVNVYDKGEFGAFMSGIILFTVDTIVMYQINTRWLLKDYL